MEITEEYANELIKKTIEFDKKMENPLFLEKIKREEEIMKNIDLRELAGLIE